MGDGDEGWGMLMDGELRRGFDWRGGVSLFLSLFLSHSPTRTLSHTHSDVPVCWTALKCSHAGFIHQQKAAHLEAICSRQCSIT